MYTLLSKFSDPFDDSFEWAALTRRIRSFLGDIRCILMEDRGKWLFRILSALVSPIVTPNGRNRHNDLTFLPRFRFNATVHRQLDFYENPSFFRLSLLLFIVSLEVYGNVKKFHLKFSICSVQFSWRSIPFKLLMLFIIDFSFRNSQFLFQNLPAIQIIIIKCTCLFFLRDNVGKPVVPRQHISHQSSGSGLGHDL